MSAIVINNLTKRVGKRKIFSNLNLEVIEGESLALLGLEESGKTTLAKILFNYLKPCSNIYKSIVVIKRTIDFNYFIIS